MKEKSENSKIAVDIEPMHLSVGFKDLDFLNIILVQVDKNILTLL